MPEERTLCLVDASAYVFRAYHAIRGLTNSKGMATNAIFGYVKALLKAYEDMKPTHVAVVMDSVGKSFRHDMYPAYKANRPPVPTDLKEQFPYIEPVTEALGFPTVRVEGFEADDVIATLAVKGSEAGMKVVIVSADKDLMQLIGDGVTMYDSMRDKLYDSDAVVEKFRVPPNKIVDLLALMGDSSDNVPGVRGIGPKGAAKLIDQFGDVETLLANTHAVGGKKQAAALEEHKEEALLSKRLVTLDTAVLLPCELESLLPRAKNMAKLRELYTLFGFRRLLADLLPTSDEPVEVDAGAPVMPETIIIWTEEQLEELVAAVRKEGRVAVDTETTSTRPMAAALVGISACPSPDKVYYIPIAHRGARAEEQLPLDVVRRHLGPLLADPKCRKIGQNFKYDTVILRNHGFDVEGLAFDPMLASYLLNPGRTSHGLDNLSVELLGVRLISFKEVAGTGAKQVTFDLVPIRQAAKYAGEDAWATLLLADLLEPDIEKAGMSSLLHDLEIPVSDMLARMEMDGIAVDSERLGLLSDEFTERLIGLEREIHGLAGVPFNLNSPKQLSEILFDRIGLRPGKKTKTGYSTDVKVLEELSRVHPLPKKMLEHRTFAKLKSTYVDVLPTLVNRTTGRIHTSFNQAITATGRLSSSDPNLQNIPIRGDEGKRIRQAFVPAPGMRLLSADYSQIELRMLAHLAQDQVLGEAFRRGEDIHSRTAAEIFRVLPGMITPDMRRVAKTINFGIVYGMSAFRLARDQGIPVKQAKAFIDTYFSRYSGIKSFLDGSVAVARERGYAETILKRRRYLPDLNASNHQVRSMAERMAVNTPVQGGAADIMKLAMLAVDRRLRETGLPVRVLLQVHDELVLEVEAGREHDVIEAVRETMEGAYTLSVPLKVDIGIGDNWAEVHG